MKHHFPSLDIHASTQLTTHNEGQIQLFGKTGASRVNLSSELNLPDVKALTSLAHKHDVLTEVFVHGALCIAFWSSDTQARSALVIQVILAVAAKRAEMSVKPQQLVITSHSI